MAPPTVVSLPSMCREAAGGLQYKYETWSCQWSTAHTHSTHTAHTQNPAGQEWGRLSTGTVELISSWLNHLFVSPVLFSGKISLSSMATSYLVTGEHSVLIEIL